MLFFYTLCIVIELGLSVFRQVYWIWRCSLFFFLFFFSINMHVLHFSFNELSTHHHFCLLLLQTLMGQLWSNYYILNRKKKKKVVWCVKLDSLLLHFSIVNAFWFETRSWISFFKQFFPEGIFCLFSNWKKKKPEGIFILNWSFSWNSLSTLIFNK